MAIDEPLAPSLRLSGGTRSQRSKGYVVWPLRREWQLHEGEESKLLLNLLIRGLKPYARSVILVITLIAIQTVGNLYLPNLNANLINNGVVKGDISYIWQTGGVMIGITLLLGVISVIAVYYASRTAMGLGRDLRRAVFNKVQSFSEYDMNRFTTPSLITMNTNDVQQIQLFLQVALTMMVMAPIMGIGGILMALREDLRLSLVIVVVVPVMGLVIGVMVRAVVPRFRRMQVQIDRINQVLREQITGVRVIRAFIRTEDEQVRFEDANSDLTKTALRINRVFAIAMPALMAILNLATIAVVWLGGHLIASGSMPVGNLVAFITYITQIFFSVMIAVFVVVLLPRAMASADRLELVLAAPSTVVDPKSPVAPLLHNGLVRFDHVEFSYVGSEQPVLFDINFTVEPAKTTAIIGGTGSGKTTLINLIPRFYDTTKGHVELNGVDITRLELELLWKDIGIVPQSSYLFSGTVADNLRFGRPEATDGEMWRALEIAQAKEFVQLMDGGLNAAIDQGGRNVSGGQRQRLCIARALVKQPSVYLFDDCFSALDAATDAKLRSALRSQLTSATVVIVAQRVSTIMHADTIVVLDMGRIVGMGSHEDLLVNCPEYKEIVESQQAQGVAR